MEEYNRRFWRIDHGSLPHPDLSDRQSHPKPHFRYTAKNQKNQTLPSAKPERVVEMSGNEDRKVSEP